MIGWLRNKLFLFRWGTSARNWPLERFLPTTDLDLTDAERAELSQGIHDWRQLVPRFLQRFGGTANEQIYCFGVAHGSTVKGLVNGFRNRAMPIPHMHLFDSFEGLPAEDAGVARPPVWSVGAYAAPRAKLEARIKALGLTPDSYSIFEGWFGDTLDPALVSGGTFKPAAYVDIDADLYNSTRDVLDFLFRHRLVRPGTLIGYDDWGDTDLWTAGESRAHKEVLAQYGAECAQLFSWGQQPLIKKLFLVVSVAEEQQLTAA